MNSTITNISELNSLINNNPTNQELLNILSNASVKVLNPVEKKKSQMIVITRHGKTEYNKLGKRIYLFIIGIYFKLIDSTFDICTFLKEYLQVIYMIIIEIKCLFVFLIIKLTNNNYNLQL